MIRKGIYSDIEKLLLITRSCAKHLINQNIFQWNETYPNEKSFQNDCKNDWLYVLEINDTIIGCISVTTEMDKEYENVRWMSKNQNNIYIHRLAISPEYQCRGYAQQLMGFAEKFAKDKKCISIRLDTFSKNQKNQNFYKKRGYKKLGNIFFPKQSEFPFICYEKVL